MIQDNLLEIASNEIWKLLQYPDLVQVCKTNKRSIRILNNRQTWSYLLTRDYPRWREYIRRPPDFKVDDPRECYEIFYWFAVPVSSPFTYVGLIKFPEHGDEFIRRRCKNIISREARSPITALLFSEWRLDTFKAIISGKNIYDLVFKAVEIIRHETRQSLIELLEGYCERYNTTFKQVLDNIIARWVEPNYEDDLPHMVRIN